MRSETRLVIVFALVVIGLLLIKPAHALETVHHHTGKVHNVFIYGMFKPSNHNIKHAMNVLDRAKQGETVILNIKSGGGSDVTMYKLLKKMKKSKAYVITKNRDYALSAGAIVGISGNCIKRSNPTVWLFHVARYMHNNKLVAMKYRIKDLALLRSIHPNILTKKEAKQFLKGKDIILSGYQIEQRMPKRICKP